MLIIAIPVAVLYLMYWSCLRKSSGALAKTESKEDMSAINELVSNLNEEETVIQEKLVSRQQTMMQLNFFKKFIVVLVLCVGFWCYRTPAMFYYFVSEVPQYSITLPIAAFLGTHWFEGRYDKSIKKLEKKKTNLSDKMKDTEKLLVDRLDPEIYKTLKRIVMKEEKQKFEMMKLHEMGCSEKCRVKNLSLELDLDRNSKIVK